VFVKKGSFVACSLLKVAGIVPAKKKFSIGINWYAREQIGKGNNGRGSLINAGRLMKWAV